MYVRIVTFEIQGLRAHEYEQRCEQIAPAFADWPGLVTKVWLADRATARYGGVYLFDSKAAADASRSTPQFAALEAEPAFADLRIVEYDTLAAPTAVTAGPLVHLAEAA